MAIIAYLERLTSQSENITVDLRYLVERANYLMRIAKMHNVTLDDLPELNDLSSIAPLHTFVVKCELALRREDVNF